MTARRTVILGAGPIGLSAAFHLGQDALLVERESRVGGCCRSVSADGFTFDMAGRIMFSNEPYVHELYTLLLRDNVHWQEREAWVYGPLKAARAKPRGNGNVIEADARFGYPLRGGFQALMDAFLPYIQGEVRVDAEVTAISPESREVTFADGSSAPYEALIATAPLPRLISLLGAEASKEIREVSAELTHVSVRCVNLGIGRAELIDNHWIHAPEGAAFDRVIAQGNSSPHCSPPGGFGLTCEITYSERKPLLEDGEALTRRCLEDLRRIGIVGPDDPLWTACQTDLPYAYVAFDELRGEHLDLIRAWLETRDILLEGRFSEAEYYDSDHALIAGRNAALTAEKILASRSGEVDTHAEPAATGRMPLFGWAIGQEPPPRHRYLPGLSLG